MLIEQRKDCIQNRTIIKIYYEPFPKIGGVTKMLRSFLNDKLKYMHTNK